MRKYLPTIAELIDRLSIIQLKEVFIPEHKEEYAKEIKDIVHDLDELGLLKEYDYSNLGKLIIRNTAKNIIQDQVEDGGRKDYKVDCIAAEFDDWEVSW